MIHRTLVSVLLLLLLPATASAADWPQVGFDGGRSFHNPDEHVLTRQTVPTLSRAWKVKFDDLEGGPIEVTVRHRRVQAERSVKSYWLSR